MEKASENENIQTVPEDSQLKQYEQKVKDLIDIISENDHDMFILIGSNDEIISACSASPKKLANMLAFASSDKPEIAFAINAASMI